MPTKKLIITYAIALSVFAACGCNKLAPLEVVTKTPAAPKLAQPANNVVTAANPLLVWRRPINTTSFTLQVGTDSTFASGVISTSVEGDTFKQLPVLDSAANIYYWRVCATGAGGTSPWSMRAFVPTAHGPAPAPLISYPLFNSFNNDSVIGWTPIIRGALTYQLQVATDAGFSALVLDESGLTATKRDINWLPTTPGLSPMSVYYYRVNATNSYATSPWSPVVQYRTKPLSKDTCKFAGEAVALCAAIDAVNGYIFVGADDQTHNSRALRVHALTLTPPNIPVSAVSALSTKSVIYGIALAGNYAYLANYDRGLRVVDRTNPAAMVAVDSIAISGLAEAVAVAGSYLYLAAGEAGLHIFSLADPAHPALVGTCNTPGYARGLAVSGNYAYVADGLYGLQIINVTNPASPAIAGSHGPSRYTNGVAVNGSYAYVADDDGLKVISVASPSSPSLVASRKMLKPAVGVAFADNRAYVANNDEGTRIIDVSVPANPEEIGYFKLGLALGVNVVDKYVVTTSYLDGLSILQVKP